MGFSSSSVEKNPPPMQEMQETWIRSLGREDPSEEGMATHPNILAWRIPWQRSLAGYSHSVTKRHDWSNCVCVCICYILYICMYVCMYVCVYIWAYLVAWWWRIHMSQNTWVRKIPWRRKWQPTPVFLSEEFSWTEEPGGLQPIGSQRVRRYWAWTQLQPTATICVCVCVCVCKAKWMSLGSSKYIFYESVSKSNTADKNLKALWMFILLQASEEVGDTNTELKIDERVYHVYIKHGT